MKILVCSFYGTNTPHFETELEIIQAHLDAGDIVSVLGCNAELLACDINPFHQVAACANCWGRRTVALSGLSPGLRAEKLLHLTKTNKKELRDIKTSFQNVEELKSYEIENFDVGYAVLSSLISRLRDPDPDVNRRAGLIRDLIISSVATYRSLQNYLDQTSFDRVYIYNGRYAPFRALLRACESRNVPFYTHERGHDIRHYALFPNTKPHDREYIENRIREAWANASSDPQREVIAARFFNERSVGVDQSWYSFVKDQKTSLLPEEWNSLKKNVVVFNSSEDEFIAIGDSWKNPLYRSQEEALDRLIEIIPQLPEDIHLYLRMHPNLKDVKNRTTEKLRTLSIPRLTIIQSADPVSTYALIRHSEKVLTFGSTVGIEATYWGKPSVLAGVSFYRNLGATYNPGTHEEMIHLIQSRLEPKDKLGALMFGFYMGTFGIPFKYFEPTGILKGTFRGRHLEPKRWVKKTAALSSLMGSFAYRGARGFTQKRLTGRFRTAH